jgi:hypothetical protein
VELVVWVQVEGLFTLIYRWQYPFDFVNILFTKYVGVKQVSSLFVETFLQKSQMLQWHYFECVLTRKQLIAVVEAVPETMKIFELPKKSN